MGGDKVPKTFPFSSTLYFLRATHSLFFMMFFEFPWTHTVLKSCGQEAVVKTVFGDANFPLMADLPGQN